MIKRKTRSALLSIIVTLSILISCGGTVLADPVDPQQGDAGAQTEQAGPEDPADTKTPVEEGDSEKPAAPAKSRNADSGDAGDSGSSTTPVNGDPQDGPNTSGTFGNGFSWKFEEGKLTISGSGAMPDFAVGDAKPWADYATQIASIKINAGITKVGDNAFNGCITATSVSLPYGLTEIGENAFTNCAFSYISLQETITTIGAKAFKYCKQLGSIDLSHVTTIGASAFEGSGLTSVTIGANVTTIEDMTFADCEKLEQVSISSNGKLTAIKGFAFLNCEKLTSITIPATVTSISNNAFKDCDTLATVNCYANPEKLTWGVSADDFIADKETTCKVPSRYLDKYVELHGNLNLTFAGSSFASGECGDNLNWVIDSDGTMVISGTGAMDDFGEYDQPWEGYMYRIKNIYIGSGVTTIGTYAFCSAYSLKSVIISEGLTKIGDYAFYDDTVLNSISIPASVTTIGSYAFYNTSLLTSVTIADNSNLKKIDEYAFKYSGLKSISLPDGLECISAHAFENSDLESITIPGSVKTWGQYSFANCSELKSLTVSNGVKTIPNSAFYKCVYLSNVSLADSITSIESYAFNNDYYYDSEYDYYQELGSISSLTLPSNLTSIGEGAFRGQSFNSITIPGSVKNIDYKTFEGCGNLNSITILKGTETISGYAFDVCNNIKSVSIADTVTSIGNKALGDGSKMEDIFLYPSPANITTFSYSGSNINSNTKIHVSNDYLQDYKTKFSDIAGQFVGDLNTNTEALVDIGSGVHLYGYSLSLAGDIGVNFWFKIAEQYLNDNNYIKFTVNGEEQIVKVSEANATSNSDYVSFRCSVVAKEMTDVITAQFYLADDTAVGSAYTYSVREYAEYVLTHQYSANAKSLVKAMLNYGACSQKHFGYNVNSLPNSSLDDDESNVNIANPDSIVFGSYETGYLAPARVSLVLNSTVTLKMYFNKSDAEGKDFKIGNTALKTVEYGSYIVVYVENITALQITSTISFDVYENNSKLGSVQYIPAKYCKLVLGMPNDEVITDDLKRAVSSLYLFSQAAKTYSNNA